MCHVGQDDICPPPFSLGYEAVSVYHRELGNSISDGAIVNQLWQVLSYELPRLVVGV